MHLCISRPTNGSGHYSLRYGSELDGGGAHLCDSNHCRSFADNVSPSQWNASLRRRMQAHLQLM